MQNPPMKQTVRQLHQVGNSIREICRMLKLSRNTVRSILRQEPSPSLDDEPVALCKEGREETLVELIKPIITSCRGNLVRVHEILAEEYQQALAYSTLTYLVRKFQLKEEPPKRFGEYYFEPGVEMQHDTSPHHVIINGKSVKTQCASLIFGFSRMLYMQYYPCFTRFEAKVFLAEALAFMQGSCRRCIIDNTSVILASGAGKYAVVAPEFVYFNRTFGFEFIAHAVMDSNRKGKIERPFYYIETNFLVGRTFTDWTDLNKQARLWCENIANHKPKRALEMAPETAYVQEKPHLLTLPEVMPHIYNHEQRIGDTQGYINLETNRYSIPECHIGHTMDIYQYINKVDIYYKNRLVASHPRLTGVRNKRTCIKGHHVTLRREGRYKESCESAELLTGIHPILDAYVLKLKSTVRGRGFVAFAQLLNLKQLYPFKSFIAVIEQAHHFNLYDIKRVENMILKHIRNDIFNM